MQRWQLRRVANAVNLSTPLGLAVGVLGRTRFSAGPRGLVLATSYRLPFPAAPAFTVGDVVLSRHNLDWLERRPALLRHEEGHSRQYAVCLGLPMLPLYVLAAGYSYLRGGDFGVHNVFERLAGLEDGGYPLLSARARARPDQPVRAATDR